MDEEPIIKKKKNSNSKAGIIVWIVVALLIILGIFFIAKKTNWFGLGNKNIVVDGNELPEGIVFNTVDGKFNLRIVDSDNEKASSDLINFYGLSPEKYVIKNYAYLNGDLLIICGVIADEKYTTYIGVYPDNIEESNQYFLVDNEKKTLLEFPSNIDIIDSFAHFNSATAGIFHVKVDAGYFFVNDCEKGAIVYTTDWKELGYVNVASIETDSDGIYVYKNADLSGSKIKYGVDGNTI